VTVQPAHGLNADEIEKLVSESIEHAHDDFTQRRLIELRNKADTDLQHTDKALAQAGDRLAAEERERIADAAIHLRAAVALADLTGLQKRLDEFAAATNPLATILMNEVLRKSLGGKGEAELGKGKL
jgi:molecular chaperone DnaK (HSP70)